MTRRRLGDWLLERARRDRPHVQPSGDPPEANPPPEATFVNPVGEGADPSVVRDGHRYLWCQSEGNVGVSVWVSDRLTTMGVKHVVWRAPADGAVSREVWAPEMIKLGGRWYIYFAASDGDNRNHLSYVLAAGTDPLGPYTLHGPLATGHDLHAPPLWAIDMTVLDLAGSLYSIWSGWPDVDTDIQHLYIAPMRSPLELAGPRVRLCANDDHLWERTEESTDSRGLHEAPQVLTRAGRTFVTYSCSASWRPTYKVGILELTGDDPLSAASWTKAPQPVFSGTSTTFGVGHGAFVRSHSSDEWWHVFHAKWDRDDNWRRALHVQPFRWHEDGSPDLGSPLAPETPVRCPAGTPAEKLDGPRSWSFGSGSLKHFDVYAHHQLVAETEAGLELGIRPATPVNDYRCGEKVVLRDGWYDDVTVTTTFGIPSGHGEAGVLLRVTGPAVGYDAHRGYYAAVAPARAVLLLGVTDGIRWTELAAAPVRIVPGSSYTLVVDAVGAELRCHLADQPLAVVNISNTGYRVGSVGLRVVDTHAVFSTLAVLPADHG